MDDAGCRRGACSCESCKNQRLFIGAKEAKFPYFTKGNQSPLGLYRNPPTFFCTNPRFVLLICDRRFVLFSLRRASAFVTNLQCLRDSYVLSHPPKHLSLLQLAEVRKRYFYYFKYGYLSYKNISIHYRRPLFTPRSHVMCVLLWMHTLYLTTFDLLNTTTHPCHYRAWKSQDNFKHNYDWIHLKEVIHT